MTCTVAIVEDNAGIRDNLVARWNGCPGYRAWAPAMVDDDFTGVSPMSCQIVRTVVQFFHQAGPSDEVSENPSPRAKEISDRLGISGKTVSTHVNHTEAERPPPHRGSREISADGKVAGLSIVNHAALACSRIRLVRILVNLIGGALAACAVYAEPRWSNPLIDNVPAAFAQISSSGSKLGAWSGEVLPYPSYSLNASHDFADNHFQGIQRLRTGPYLVLSGGNIGRLGDTERLGLPKPDNWEALPPPRGDIIIARLASRPAIGEWRSNLDTSALPSPQDRAIGKASATIALPSGTTLWHPGGISACGDILVVPVENYNAAHGAVCSQILFYDLSAPEKPARLSPLIDRTVPPMQDKAGAATMTRIRDGRFLVASRTTSHLSFYLSHSSRFAGGFEPRPAVVFDERDAVAALGQERVKFHGSSIHFATQRDGKLFLIGFSRVRDDREPGASRYSGHHLATLFAVDFPQDNLRAMPVITKIAARAFGSDVLGYDRWGDFAAAAGLHVTDSGRLAIYAAPRWQVARVQPMTPEDLARGRQVQPDEATFIPLAEFWPRD